MSNPARILGSNISSTPIHLPQDAFRTRYPQHMHALLMKKIGLSTEKVAVIIIIKEIK